MYHVAYSPNTSLIALANDNGEISLWDADDGTQLTTIRGDSGRVTGLAISPDNRLLLCGYGNPARLFMYHIERAAKIAVVKYPSTQVNDIQFSRDNRFLLIVHAGIMLTDGRTLKTIRTDNEFQPYALAAMSVDGALLALSQPESEVCHIVDSLSGDVLAAAGDGSIQAMAFAPNKKSLFVWSGYALKQWNLRSGEIMRVLVESNPADDMRVAECGRIAPNGKLLVTCGAGGYAAMMDIQNGALLYELPLSGRTAFDFSPGSKKLLVADENGAALLKSENGKVIRRFNPQNR